MSEIIMSEILNKININKLRVSEQKLFAERSTGFCISFFGNFSSFGNFPIGQKLPDEQLINKS
jgi:hypothetical protein